MKRKKARKDRTPATGTTRRTSEERPGLVTFTDDPQQINELLRRMASSPQSFLLIEADFVDDPSGET